MGEGGGEGAGGGGEGAGEPEDTGGGESVAAGGDGEASGGLDTDATPVSTNGVTMLPTLPLIENTIVSTSVAVALPVKNTKLTASPSLSP